MNYPPTDEQVVASNIAAAITAICVESLNSIEIDKIIQQLRNLDINAHGQQHSTLSAAMLGAALTIAIQSHIKDI